MRPLVFLLLMLLISSRSVGAAEDILVVSGEHDGYTRLVFTVLPDQDWVLNSTSRSAELRFNSSNLTFDSSRVFDRITTTRLESARVDRGEAFTAYKLQLGCGCDVTAFSYLEQYVVVDITDQQPRDGQIFVFTPAAWVTPTAPSFVSTPQEVNFSAQLDSLSASVFLATSPPDAPPARMQVDQSIKPEENSVGEDIQKAVGLAHSSLLRQVMVAADQGLLDLTSVTPEVNESPPTNSLERPEKARVPILNSNQVTIQTVFDRDAGATPRLNGVEESYCPPEKKLDIASWADGEDFIGDVSLVRRHIFKEFDEPDYAAIERLIKTYLRYGFGAEARRYLLDYGSKINDEKLLSDMATIVDGNHAQAQGPFSRAITCDGAAGLWAMVGYYPDVQSPTGDSSSVIDAFADLPINIRRILGPRLASAFVDRGEIDTARLISNILERAAGEINDDHKLVIGNLMQATGHNEEAVSTYQTLKNGNSSVAIDALIRIASLGLEADQSPPEHILSDLNVAVDMWRGTDKEKTLRRLEALWTARLVSGAEAIGSLKQVIDKDLAMAGLLGQTALEILRNISTNESGYAATIYSYRDYIPMDQTADELRLEIAKKLISEGLPDFAVETLHPLVKRDDIAAKLVTSKAHLSAFRPAEALLTLANIAGDEAKILRVEAFLFDGDFEHALEELQELENQTITIVQPRWFSGDWANIVLVNSAAAKIRSEYFLNSGRQPTIPNDIDKQPITLSFMQDVLERSRSVSEELRDDIFR